LTAKDLTIYSQDTEFGSPLIAAVEKGSMELVQLLLSRGANLNIKAEKTDYPTALQMAVRNGSVEIVKLLLVKGADPNVNGGCYHTALQIAALNGSIEIVGLLLNNTIRAKPNTKGINVLDWTEVLLTLLKVVKAQLYMPPYSKVTKP
ncbi:ankyrin repeat-containing domain protein, partial [Crepidotus variabilis]